jgi:hypothetical protein
MKKIIYEDLALVNPYGRIHRPQKCVLEASPDFLFLADFS